MSINVFPKLTKNNTSKRVQGWNNSSKIKPDKTVKAVAVVTLVVATGVILSTLFIKQHYIADEIARIALAWIIWTLIFNKLWKKQALP